VRRGIPDGASGLGPRLGARDADILQCRIVQTGESAALAVQGQKRLEATPAAARQDGKEVGGGKVQDRHRISFRDAEVRYINSVERIGKMR
jgi:hypothetical protein